MEGSNPEHYPIVDFLNWDGNKELILNPDFQRGAVWQKPAQSFLIDTILRNYPIPKLLMRTRIDRETRKTIRDVVDGQQRLRAIIDFANNKLVLGTRAAEFSGMKFDDLTDEQKDSFLAYKLTCEQLTNASDEDVLEVFIRINSYSVPVNSAELRNAKYDNEFSNTVKDTVKRAKHLWDLGVLPNRSRVRMADQSLIAEIFGYFVNGVGEGDELTIDRLYKQMDSRDARVPDAELVTATIDEVVDLLQPFAGQRIAQRPQFLMLLAAYGYLTGRIEPGRINAAELPRVESYSLDKDLARSELSRINGSLSDETVPSDLEDFVEASSATTQRMRSRQVRFAQYYRALIGG